MKSLIVLISKKLFTNNTKPLGRWKIDYCNNKMNRKIDMSNEDHCGPCGQYIKTKVENVNQTFILDKSINK